MPKKLRMSREFCYIPATLFLALGAALMSKADFGLSSIVAPAYLLSQIFGISFGTAEYCLQGVLVLAVCLIVRLFRFWADKAAVAADFHLRKWHLLLWETRNSKHSRCTYTLRFLQKSALLAKHQLVLASRARRYPLVHYSKFQRC